VRPTIQALALAAELDHMGFRTAVLRTGGHMRYPAVWVASGKECMVRATEVVYTAPDDYGDLYFWFADTLDPISPAEYIGVAAEIIAAMLTKQRMRLFGVRVL
jgi:hypothetical protein